jgi:hypothetical protein
MRYFLGLDLGQAADYSALAILEAQQGGRDDTYNCRHLQRWPLRTPYPEIVADVARMARSPELSGTRPIFLAVDATGVGAPVVDLFRAEFGDERKIKLQVIPLDNRPMPKLSPDVKVCPVQITGGDQVTRERGLTRVPKRDLVSVAQVALQTQRLKIAPALAEAQTLTQELLNFKVKISLETAHDSYGAWREGQHDDLVLAVALALWMGIDARPVPTIVPEIIEHYSFGYREY